MAYEDNLIDSIFFSISTYIKKQPEYPGPASLRPVNNIKNTPEDAHN